VVHNPDEARKQRSSRVVQSRAIGNARACFWK